MGRLFVLGSKDIEMDAVESLLRSQREDYVYAKFGGKRVSPSTAYTDGDLIEVDGYDQLVLVECKPKTSKDIDSVSVDHHFPGDHGYGKPPILFWCASSLGQVWSILMPKTEIPPKKYKYIAAADHCLRQAYNGECPGINRDFLIDRRLRIKAAFKGKTQEDIKRHITNAINAINIIRERNINIVDIGGETVIDLREGVLICPECDEIIVLQNTNKIKLDMANKECDHSKAQWSPSLPEIMEASCIAGIAVFEVVKERDTQRKKVLLMGSNGKAVDVFLNKMSKEMDLEEVYGDIQRGFAGGYLKTLKIGGNE
jgi:hypothetical protein